VRRSILQALGDEVRERRELCDLTQEALAEAAGLNTNVIGRLERGRNNCRVLTLFDVALALDMPLAELIAGAARRR
jgi:transcriptional regulator with XRE-family HTH domain